jgi:hypothetical protein
MARQLMSLQLMSKTQVAKNQEPKQNQELGFVPANADLLIDIAAAFLLGFPVAANGRGSSTGIGVDQITWPNGAGQVSALRQVLTEVTAGKDAGMSTRCGCGPAGDSFASWQIQGQCPAGVDSGYGADWNAVAAKHVFDYNNLFAHLNLGKPKEHQSTVANQCHDTNALNDTGYAIGCKDAQQSQRHGNNDNYREHPRGLSNENLHTTSVAVNGKVCA